MTYNCTSAKNSGFTLVEIMIVSAIIALLAVIVVPSFIRARSTSQTNICINNLRIIGAAKNILAIENFMADGNTVNDTDLDPYLKVNLADLAEPSSGTYTVHSIGSPPTCSIGGDHVLP